MPKYLPGQSGNLSGKPKGIIHRRTQLAKLLEPHAQELIQKMVELALAGDSNALRLCVERLIPKPRGETIALELPEMDMTKVDFLLKFGTQIIQAVTQSEVTVEQGKTLADIFVKENNHEDLISVNWAIHELEHIHPKENVASVQYAFIVNLNSLELLIEKFG